MIRSKIRVGLILRRSFRERRETLLIRGILAGILLSGVWANSALEAQERESTRLELQLNSQFWQLLSWEELLPLSELRREANGVHRVVPLESLYPDFRSVESMDSRNLEGELLEVRVGSLERSHLRLRQNGELTLFLAGGVQQNPQQLNIYGETWPKATLELWLEEGFEQPFLLSKLETYQQFHNLQIEVQVVKDLKQAAGQSIHGKGLNLPDMILADQETTDMLRSLLQEFSLREKFASLAFLELLGSNKQYYSVPLALESYSLLYNSELLGKEEQDALHSLSEFFVQLEKLSKGATVKNNPYFLGFGTDTLPFSLLLYSFLKANNYFTDTSDLHIGLQYLREQGRKGLFRQLDFPEERFVQGDIAAIITRSGKLQNILDLANSASYIKIAAMPFNDLGDNDVLEYSRIWCLSILRESPVKSQAANLRSYLLGGAVQGQFDLSQGILPSNTMYYPFYQNSLYYRLLPKAELRYAMSPEELWEYGIERRSVHQKIEAFDRLFRDRIGILLDSDIDLLQVLADLQQQWQQEVVPGRNLLFLR